jgi:hypothetical protein
MEEFHRLQQQLLAAQASVQLRRQYLQCLQHKIDAMKQQHMTRSNTTRASSDKPPIRRTRLRKTASFGKRGDNDDPEMYSRTDSKHISLQQQDLGNKKTTAVDVSNTTHQAVSKASRSLEGMVHSEDFVTSSNRNDQKAEQVMVAKRASRRMLPTAPNNMRSAQDSTYGIPSFGEKERVAQHLIEHVNHDRSKVALSDSLPRDAPPMPSAPSSEVTDKSTLLARRPPLGNNIKHVANHHDGSSQNGRRTKRTSVGNKYKENAVFGGKL